MSGSDDESFKCAEIHWKPDESYSVAENNARVITFFFCFHVVNNTKPMNILMSIGKTCDVVNEYAYYNLKRVREYFIYFPLFLDRPCKISLVRQVQAYKALLWQSKICHGDSKKGKKRQWSE